MCISNIGQLLFGITMFVTLMLTIAAFLTPGWRSFSVVKDNESEAKKYSMPKAMGLLQCTSSVSENSPKIDYCHLWRNRNDLYDALTYLNPSPSNGDTMVIQWSLKYFQNKPKCDENVTKLMIATLVLQIGSLIWVAVTFCACCCREFWILLLPLAAFLSTTTFAIALFIYTRNNGTAFDILNESKEAASKAYHIDFFYSYYIALVALFLSIICILIGVLAKKLAHICC